MTTNTPSEQPAIPCVYGCKCEKHYQPAIPASAGGAEAISNAADLLDDYAAFIRTVNANDLERHPYLPAVEQAIEDLRSLPLEHPAQASEVERLARAAYEGHVARNKPWAVESLFQKERWRASARAMLAALNPSQERAEVDHG